jgi:hypothetical protein
VRPADRRRPSRHHHRRRWLEFARGFASVLARFQKPLAKLVYLLRDRLLLGCDLIEVGGPALIIQGRDRQTISILRQRIREPIEGSKPEAETLFSGSVYESPTGMPDAQCLECRFADTTGYDSRV